MTTDKTSDQQPPEHAQDTATSGESSVEERRKTLRKLLVGGGVLGAAGSLPDTWSKPLVDSVLLPAHANTSATPGPTPRPTPRPTPSPTGS